MQMEATDGAASGSRGRKQKWRGKEGRKSREGEEEKRPEKKEGKGGHVPLTWPTLYLAKKSILILQFHDFNLFFFYK